MFPRKFYRLVFAFLMSVFMSFIMSGIITFLNLGFQADFFEQWLLEAFPKAWVVAFPIVFFLAPCVAKLTEFLMRE
ncbi:DUF2798 domain-containing protein [Helicobacter turcicus]|uniref:DUF2798 domain-containing protein n=2 Tax=Helicobacter turcicus TaxID=2867412 RepID=A0ABS7JP69_9HELI|nr:DUF2798 domain-containing protein [Helicobacter turcicus]MBX7491164.1 DUF2798 domain-containing protein [Helicobacter turcicus]MBX7546031.1 DUF2798 domain-containing protein [Helicobacter turcicus]